MDSSSTDKKVHIKELGFRGRRHLFCADQKRENFIVKIKKNIGVKNLIKRLRIK